MTRRTAGLAGVGVAVIAAIIVAAVVSRSGGGASKPTATATNAAALPSRTVTAGAVTVKVDPHHIDNAGAEFKVSFDTHSVDLGFDIPRAARLTVNGNSWAVGAWSGDGPGGHHRAGTLRFTSAGPATGEATLQISGLPKPVTAEWTLTDR